MSYCYVKRASYTILYHKAVFVKNIYIVIYLCLNMKMSGKTYDETLIVNVCEWWDFFIYFFLYAYLYFIIFLQ